MTTSARKKLTPRAIIVLRLCCQGIDSATLMVFLVKGTLVAFMDSECGLVPSVSFI